MPRLYPTIRPGARYYASLRLLESVKRHDPSIFTKSGVMVGLGEQRLEVHQVMDDMRSADVDFLTMGQYLQPTPRHAKVEEFVTPQAFDAYAAIARAKGFLLVAASPLTRSSYHAGDDFEKMRAAREAQAGGRALGADAAPHRNAHPALHARADVRSRRRRRPLSGVPALGGRDAGPLGQRDRDGRRPRRRLQARSRRPSPRGCTSSGPTEIEIDYVEGPLKYLHNSWKFRADGKGGTEVDFCVDFAFRNRMFEALAGQMFDRALRRMIGAFEERAARALRRWRVRQQQLERAKRRLKPDAAAAEIAEILRCRRRSSSGSASRSARAKTTVPTGLRSDAAAGAGDAGDRDRDVGAAMRASAPCAIAQATATETAPNVSITSLADAEQLGLGLVRIGDEAGLEHVGAAGDLGQRGGDQAAGAAFRDRDPAPGGAVGLDHPAGERRPARRAGHSRESRSFVLRQPHGGDRLGGDAFAAAGEAQPLGRRRLDANPRRRQPQQAGDPLRASRPDAGRSAAPRR